MELCQLYHHFGHPFAKKLYKVLKCASHKTDKKIIENLIKYCMHYQNYEKSLAVSNSP